MNICTFIGRMTKDVELSQNGETVMARFSIAVDDGYGDKKHTSFFDMTAFAKTAENIQKYFHKGDRIGLECQARQNTWEKDGKKYSAVGFTVRSFEFIEKKRESSEQKGTDDFMAIPDSIQEELPFH